MFELDTKEKKKQSDKKEKLEAEINKLSKEIDEIKLNAVFKNAFEWRFEFPEVLNNDGEFEGFDLIIGNPPYIQLQTLGKDADALAMMNYKTYARMGDIYSLFYEKGNDVLKKNGILSFITSNKWMRAGYGELTRKYLSEYTNPLLLIDFSGHKVFENVTVDTNILMFHKAENKNETQACVISDKLSSNLTEFVKENASTGKFNTSESWVILNSIEQRIKEKIEKIGTPLKNWDISIYRGILTGYNEAFIIDDKKKSALIEQDPKSAEIIRPILRGRDIKRYCYEFADLYLITTFPSMKINIDKYPAIKEHLLSFGYDRLNQTGENGARKKTNNQWFETQDSISYWEDFSKQKIVWAETMRIHKQEKEKFPRFSFDDNGYQTDKTCFFAIGESLKYILTILNSSLGRFMCSQYVSILDNGGYLMQKIYLESFPILKPDEASKNLLEDHCSKIFNSKSKQDIFRIEEEIDKLVFKLYGFNEEEANFIILQNLT